MKKEIVLVLWYFSNCSYFQIKKKYQFFQFTFRTFNKIFCHRRYKNILNGQGKGLGKYS